MSTRVSSTILASLQENLILFHVKCKDQSVYPQSLISDVVIFSIESIRVNLASCQVLIF